MHSNETLIVEFAICFAAFELVLLCAALPPTLHKPQLAEAPTENELLEDLL